MADRNETMADIVAEMRGEKAAIGLTAWGLMNRVDKVQEEFRKLADRIEAAEKLDRQDAMKTAMMTKCEICGRLNIVNAAKLREALERISKQEELFHRHLNNEQYARAGDAIEFLSEASEAAKAALAAPPRNCDRFATLEDARNAFFADYVPDETRSSATAFAEWLMDTAAQEGGDHD